MSKVSKDSLYEAVDMILKNSKGEGEEGDKHKRNFTESIELQVSYTTRNSLSTRRPHPG